MSIFEVVILGIIQGLTEFLPISSSGHLLLFEHLFGIANLEDYIFFNLVCHLGTLFAIFTVFWKEILLILAYDRKRVLQVVLGTLPLFGVVLLIKPIKALFDIHFVGFFFLVSAALLYASVRFGVPPENTHEKRDSLKDPLLIGLFQAIASLPGISRSGATISIARILGWKPSEAVLFSFLLAIPAILGATFFELIELAGGGMQVLLTPFQYVLAFFSSYFVGYFALKLLIRLASKDRFMYFVYYLLCIGLITIITANF